MSNQLPALYSSCLSNADDVNSSWYFTLDNEVDAGWAQTNGQDERQTERESLDSARDKPQQVPLKLSGQTDMSTNDEDGFCLLDDSETNMKPSGDKSEDRRPAITFEDALRTDQGIVVIQEEVASGSHPNVKKTTLERRVEELLRENEILNKQLMELRFYATSEAAPSQQDLYPELCQDNQSAGTCETGAATHQPLASDAPSTDSHAISFDQLAAEFRTNQEMFSKRLDQMEQQQQQKNLTDSPRLQGIDRELELLRRQIELARQEGRLERLARNELELQIEQLKRELDRLRLDRHSERESAEGHSSSNHSRNGCHFAAPRLAARVARCGARQPSYCSAPTAEATSGRSAPEPRRPSPQFRGDEMVSELVSNFNSFILAGYRVTADHVNRALDTLNQQVSAAANNYAEPTLD